MKIKLIIFAPHRREVIGGIKTQYDSFLAYLRNINFLSYKIIDISPFLRNGYELNFMRRIFLGSIGLIRTLLEYLKYLIFYKPSVIYLCTSGSLAIFRDICILSISRLFKLKSIYSVRMGRIPTIFNVKNFEYYLFNIVFKKADLIHVLDEETFKVLEPIYKHKVKKIPNGIDLSKISFIKNEYNKKERNATAVDSSRIVLYLGWVIPEKGIDELIESWQRLNHQEWVLKIIGPGPDYYKKSLKSKIEVKNIKICNGVSRDEAILQMLLSDILVLPSHTEGFPNVILEAMALEKAIIASSVGAIPEILNIYSKEPCGVIIPKGDSNALFQALKTLIENEKLRDELGNRAYNRVISCYSADKINSKRLIDILNLIGYKDFADKII